jgi:hypothetical protein
MANKIEGKYIVAVWIYVWFDFDIIMFKKMSFYFNLIV